MSKMYLDYKESKEKIYSDLEVALNQMSDNLEFDISRFYKYLNEIICDVDDDENLKLIKDMGTIKPMYLFGVLLYLLKDIGNTDRLEENFNYLSKFVDYRIDMFSILNHLKRNKK